jgi:glycerophosphoryl diester phosphodiesterase
MIEIIGHRGAAFDAPENTLAALRLAWEQRADAAEFDVHLGGDGEVVLIHDATTRRTAGEELRVAASTVTELKRLDVGRWKHPRFAGERIPTLGEALATLPAGKRVLIEVKCGPEVVPALDRALRDSGLKPEQAVVISFSAEVIAAAKRARPDVPAYWVVDLNPAGQPPPAAEELVAAARAIGADGLDLSATPVVLDKPFGDAVRAAGLALCVWTVNTVELAHQMIEAGVQGLTTDRPGWLREQLGL